MLFGWQKRNLISDPRKGKMMRNLAGITRRLIARPRLISNTVSYLLTMNLVEKLGLPLHYSIAFENKLGFFRPFVRLANP